MKNEKLSENILKKADDTSLLHDEELSFIDYQETINKSREARRTRWLLIALTVAVYLLGLGLFATIVQTIYQMHQKAGIITGIVLASLYTICFIIVIAQIFSRHSFDLEFRKRRNGHYSEWTNNRVRWEIASNIREQTAVLDYLGKKYQKEYLPAKESKEVEAFSTIIRLTEEHDHHYPGSKAKDSIALAEALKITMRKDGVIYKKARSIILKRSISTGAMTAISQKATMDAGIVVVKTMQMIKDIIWLYGFRPTNAEMTKILSRVVRSVAVSVGLNTMPNSANWLGKVVNKDSSNFLVSMLGQAIDMGAQFLGNGAMTYLVGKYTVNAMIKEYRLQDIFREEDLEAYEMAMSDKTFAEINAAVEEEKKVLSSNQSEKEPVASDEDIKALENSEKKHHFPFFRFHKQKKD